MFTFKNERGIGEYVVRMNGEVIGDIYKTKYLGTTMWKAVGLKGRMFSKREDAAQALVENK